MNDTPEEPFTFQFEKPQFQVSQVSTLMKLYCFCFFRFVLTWAEILFWKPTHFSAVQCFTSNKTIITTNGFFCHKLQTWIDQAEQMYVTIDWKLIREKSLRIEVLFHQFVRTSTSCCVSQQFVRNGKSVCLKLSTANCTLSTVNCPLSTVICQQKEDG